MKRFEDILCVALFNESNSPALERAVTLATRNQCALTVVDVVERVTAGIGMPDGGPISADLQNVMAKAHAERLTSLIEPYRERANIRKAVLKGTPFLEVVRDVLRNRRDLVIKAAESPDWLDRLFGSDDMHLLRKCPCPVWLIKPDAPKRYRRILATVDVDDAYPSDELETRHTMNLQVLEMASALALAEPAELHIVHTWEPVGMAVMRSAFVDTSEAEIHAYVEEVRRRSDAGLDTLMEELRDSLAPETLDSLRPERHLVRGWARKEIPVLAHRLDADLVVMGTVARTGIPGFLIGNTAEAILSQIDCSVLAIKPPGFVTPVTLED